MTTGGLLTGITWVQVGEWALLGHRGLRGGGRKPSLSWAVLCTILVFLALLSLHVGGEGQWDAK